MLPKHGLDRKIQIRLAAVVEWLIQNNTNPITAKMTRKQTVKALQKMNHTTPTAGAGDLAVYEQSQDTVVLLQTQMRSFLAKAKVRKIRTEKAAKEQGVLVAYKGTIQGETGWYTSNGQLFYFCLDRVSEIVRL